MGVKDLWTILEPVKQHKCLSELQGQVIAVDLSIWIVEAKTLQLKGVTKPHLRNLFFRVCSLLQLNITPVIVVEGEPPDLKQEVMKKRAAVQYPPRGRCTGTGQKVQRKNFTADHRECCEMLDYLGVPYVQSAGEAEAMCAFLNRNHIVDGCITNDGDAFLYGANTVYRNFTTNSKNPHVESYRMHDIEEQLHLDRERLVALAVLLGCDYLPKGVPCVGRDMAMKFMSSLPAVDSVLERFNQWSRASFSSCNVQCKSNSAEWQVWKKSLLCPGFPHKDVIDEFLIDKDKLPTCSLVWKRPKMFHLMNFAKSRMEWSEEYGMEKVLPLVSLYDITRLARNQSREVIGSCLQPCRIVKARVRHGVPCFEIEWYKIPGDTVTKADCYITVEKQQIFAKAFPEMVALFQQVTKGKEKQRHRKKGTTYRGCDLLGELAENMSRLNIDNECRKNKVEEFQTADELKKTSLRRSLSVVTLSELVTPTAMCDSEVSENQVSHCAADVARNVLPSFCSSSKQQHSADNDGHRQFSSDVSDDDCSYVEIPPLSQRLQLNHVQTEFATTDCVSARGLATRQLPSSDNVVTGSRRDKSENCCLKQSSQRSVNSDSAVLPNTRRHALILRTASVLSDVFVSDSAKPGGSGQKTCSTPSADIEKIMLKDDSGSSSKDADVFRFSSVSENDFVEKFQSALHAMDKVETFERVSTSESSLPVPEVTDEFVDVDHHVTTDVVASSIDSVTDKSNNVSSEEFSEQLMWSPRHCGNFCIETSIMNTPIMDFTSNVENDLQVNEFSVSDIDNLSNESRTSFHPVVTSSDRSAHIDEVSSSGNVSDLLFDDPVSPAEKLVLPLTVFENQCNISVTENVDSDCNDGDYSLIVID